MAKLSIACCDEDIPRGTRRKVFLQLQVNIVRVVEDKKPISIDLACKPTQTRVHCSFGMSWGNGLEICLNSIFTRGVNVEYLGEAKIK